MHPPHSRHGQHLAAVELMPFGLCVFPCDVRIQTEFLLRHSHLAVVTAPVLIARTP